MDWCSANGRDRSPSAPLPILVNLGFWLTEQKLIHNLVLFVYPPARPNKSVAALTHTVSSGLFRCYFSLLKESSFFTSSLYSTLKLLKTHFASFPLQLLSAMPSVFFFFVFFCRLSCPPPFLIYCMPSATPPDYLSITAVRLFFSQVCHSLLSAAASSSKLPAPHISLTDYTVDCVLLSVH